MKPNVNLASTRGQAVQGHTPLSIERELSTLKAENTALRHVGLKCQQMNRELCEALVMVLPLAEDYLKKAPTHPDHAKLETAYAAIKKAHGLI